MALPKTFKPEQGSGGRYTLSALKSGQKVKVRVLSDFITGKMVWSDLEDGKRAPFRVRDTDAIPTGKIGINQMTGQPERIRQFIASVVWNYATEQVEILETTKGTIIEAIYDLEQSEDWGDTKTYDITISRSGQGMDTKYSVLPSNKLAMKVKADWKNVNLEALYDGKDPFSGVDRANEHEQSIAEQVADDIPF